MRVADHLGRPGFWRKLVLILQSREARQKLPSPRSGWSDIDRPQATWKFVTPFRATQTPWHAS